MHQCDKNYRSSAISFVDSVWIVQKVANLHGRVDSFFTYRLLRWPFSKNVR